MTKHPRPGRGSGLLAVRPWPYSDEQLRAMYAGARGDVTARRFARLWAVVFALGLLPSRWVTLEVPGRRSGATTRFPLGMADLDGHWYLVLMLGNDCHWVKNVRAADGLVTLRGRPSRRCHLAEVPVAGRPPILKRSYPAVQQFGANDQGPGGSGDGDSTATSSRNREDDSSALPGSGSSTTSRLVTLRSGQERPGTGWDRLAGTDVRPSPLSPDPGSGGPDGGYAGR